MVVCPFRYPQPSHLLQGGSIDRLGERELDEGDRVDRAAPGRVREGDREEEPGERGKRVAEGGEANGDGWAVVCGWHQSLSRNGKEDATPPCASARYERENGMKDDIAPISFLPRSPRVPPV